jgi:uncharacterized membrane protein YciS (DUF1049 family)
MHTDWQFWAMYACGIATGFALGWFACRWFYRRPSVTRLRP